MVNGDQNQTILEMQQTKLNFIFAYHFCFDFWGDAQKASDIYKNRKKLRVKIAIAVTTESSTGKLSFCTTF